MYRIESLCQECGVFAHLHGTHVKAAKEQSHRN